MDSLIVGLAIEAQARKLDADAAAIRLAPPVTGGEADSLARALVAEMLAASLHDIADRLWGPDGRARHARAAPDRE